MDLKSIILIATLSAAWTLSATTIHPAQVKCGNCGEENTVTVVGSTNQMEAPDLDLRPGEMARSTLRYQVAECKKCHYCAMDLSDKPASEAAKKAIARPMPGDGLEFRFARAAEIMRAEAEASAGNPAEATEKHCYAALLFLRAAWVCDDGQKTAEAVKYRRECAVELEKVIAAKEKQDGELPRGITLMLCDVYRRTGDFAKAEQAAKRVLNAKTREQDIAEFQLELCRQKKSDRHTLGEVDDPRRKK